MIYDNFLSEFPLTCSSAFRMDNPCPTLFTGIFFQHKAIQVYRFRSYGIGIAILANGNPLGCIFASILFGFLNVMGTTMGRLPGLNIPASIIELIEGIVMICVIISYAVRYAMDVKKKKAMMRKAGV